MALVDLGAYDGVDHPGLVLEQHEDDPVGGLRALPGDDQPRDADLATVAGLAEIGGADALWRQAGVHEGHEVPAGREPGRLVVGDGALKAALLAELRCVGGRDGQCELALLAPGDPLGSGCDAELPQHLPTGLCEAVEGAGPHELGELLAS